jgi:RNA polymerase subunit RPABC4/transcription elongation factor Spt4
MWTYAKKAFVALLLSFILMYGGIFSLSLSQENGYSQQDFFSIPGHSGDSISSFSESKIMDADYKLEIHVPEQYAKISVNGKTILKYDRAPPLIYLNLTKGDKFSIFVVNNNTLASVGNSIIYTPIDHNSKFFETTGMFLFVLSVGLFVAGLSYLYLLLKVEKRRGKFVIEPENQPKKIEYVGEMPLAECSNCHKRIPADSKICPYCGAKFDPSFAICGSCGKPIPPDAVVCPYCGAKLR